MAFFVTKAIVERTKSTVFEATRLYVEREGIKEGKLFPVHLETLADEDLSDLLQAAEAVSDGRRTRALRAIIQTRTNADATKVPSFDAFEEMVRVYLSRSAINGWVFVYDHDGNAYPELVTRVSRERDTYGRGTDQEYVRISTIAFGHSLDGRVASQRGLRTRRFDFAPAQVVKKTPAAALAAMGIFKETEDLLQGYEQSMSRYREVVAPAFAKQFTLTGKVFYHEKEHYLRRNNEYQGVKVINDVEPVVLSATEHFADSLTLEGVSEGTEGRVPEHPVVRVFDLATHDYNWVHEACLTPYAYKPELRDKLVLPDAQRDLLDILTSDISVMVDDFIEGKSAGNIILCKGVPGVGKTLSAEIYSEIIGAPLYAVQSGTLGTEAKEISKNLERIFQQANRWGCVLLIDEADVFVSKRQHDIQQNAVVAEFLRKLEYFSGLMFMTTNRPDDIDEAIVSRCGAIISYTPPSGDLAKKVWAVLAQQFAQELSDELISDLTEKFPEIAPRDIKMLLRLTMRYASSKQVALDLDAFRKCAMFRAIPMNDGDRD